MTDIKVGDRVRITREYGTLSNLAATRVGMEFEVKEVIPGLNPASKNGYSHYVRGLPNGPNVWVRYLEKVSEPGTPSLRERAVIAAERQAAALERIAEALVSAQAGPNYGFWTKGA